MWQAFHNAEVVLPEEASTHALGDLVINLVDFEMKALQG
jgi:hypothetical protein